MWFKNEIIWEEVKTKILCIFISWANFTDKVPKYLKDARIIALSKDENGAEYPKYGDIRTIAITSPIIKLYELVILQQINSEIESKALLHPN